MDRIALQEIKRVCRFGSRESTWERSREVSSHFIAYKLNGSTIHEYCGETYSFCKDTIMVANRSDLYRVTQHETAAEGRQGSCIAVHFTTYEPFDLHLSVFDCRDHPQVKSAFFRMLDAWNQFMDGCPEVEYTCMARFYEICAYLSELQSGSSAGEDSRLEESRRFLERNLSDSTLTVADAAESARLSQRRFTELFAEKYGRTPGRYLTECRMRQAMELLRLPQLSVAEIAALSGYADPSYFIRVFHREIGASPNVFRSHFQ